MAVWSGNNKNILLYDVDKTGIKCFFLKHERELLNFGVKRLFLPRSGTKEENDISDFFFPEKERK
jgi:hypothetical protein